MIAKEPMIEEWREIYQREYPSLVRALLAVGRDAAAAEDAAQEAFIRAHRIGLHKIRNLSGWLFVLGSREVFRRAKRLRHERELWASLPTAPEALDVAMDRADLLRSLGQLTERQRAVIVARYFYGLSYNEIAEHFDIKSGTVGATLHHGIEQLRHIHVAGRLARGALR